MESSRRDLSIDMVVDRFIFKNYALPWFTFMPKIGKRLPVPKKQTLIFTFQLCQGKTRIY